MLRHRQQPHPHHRDCQRHLVRRRVRLSECFLCTPSRRAYITRRGARFPRSTSTLTWTVASSLAVDGTILFTASSDGYSSGSGRCVRRHRRAVERVTSVSWADWTLASTFPASATLTSPRGPLWTSLTPTCRPTAARSVSCTHPLPEHDGGTQTLPPMTALSFPTSFRSSSSGTAPPAPRRPRSRSMACPSLGRSTTAPRSSPSGHRAWPPLRY